MPALKSLEFRREREKTWLELEELIGRIDKHGVRSLSAGELTRLPYLYSATLSSLSVARAISLDRNVTEYLESLGARAYIHVYAAREGVGRTLVRFLTVDFPRAVRRFAWHVLLSFLFLVAGIVTGFELTMDEPDRYYAIMPEKMSAGRDPAASVESLREKLYTKRDDAGDLTAFSAHLATNNTQVGFLAFALGFIAAVPTFLLVFANGMYLGAFTALHHMRGLSVDVWGWLLPHGVTELAAVALCGAAGLALGQALVFPGRRTRLAALARAGRESGRIVLGAIFMFLLAGLIEGIFRQTVTSVPVRYSVAGITGAAWLAYFLFAGRRRP
jgi:uncharacterized membrane protein SpoIIM required for sporulation